MTVRDGGPPRPHSLALVTVAILATDIVFAVDSVPAVYGITGDPYLVFATNAFACSACGPSTSCSRAPCPSWSNLGYGWPRSSASSASSWSSTGAHGVWPATPEVPTLASLGVIVGILAVVTAPACGPASARSSPEAADVDPEPEPATTQR